MTNEEHDKESLIRYQAFRTCRHLCQGHKSNSEGYRYLRRVMIRLRTVENDFTEIAKVQKRMMIRYESRVEIRDLIRQIEKTGGERQRSEGIRVLRSAAQYLQTTESD